MKRTLILLISVFMLNGMAVSQNTTSKAIPIGVYVSDNAEVIPNIAQSALADKMRQIVTVNGMGADNKAQFFITCSVNVTEKQIVGGVPVKILLIADATFYIADAKTDKIFETTTIPTRGVGENENKAYIAAMKCIKPANPELKNFVTRASDKIVKYYESQIANICDKAESLAKLGSFESALYELSTVPEVCDGYSKISDTALSIYQKMIDAQSLVALQKAKTIWAAGHDFGSANEASEYIAMVSSYSSCFKDAGALLKEISDFVRSEHAYSRAKEEEQLARERKLEDEQLAWNRKMEERDKQLQSEKIAAWKAVGEAYGKNQKATVYKTSWLR